MRRECGCCGSADHLEAHAVRVTAWGQVGSVRVCGRCDRVPVKTPAVEPEQAKQERDR